MSVSKLLSRFPVGWTLAAGLALLVVLAVVDIMVDTDRVAELSVFLGRVLTAALILLLAWHFAVSIRRRRFKRLAVHLVTVPVGAFANLIIYGFALFR